MFKIEHQSELMMRATKRKSTAKRRVRFKGIVADAASLGVNRNTLYKTLTKIWHLPGLLRRYRELKSHQRAATARAA